MSEAWYEAAFGADYLDRYPHRNREEARLAITTLLGRVSLPSGARVLDFCCGAGRHALELTDRGHPVVGLDLSIDLLREAHRSSGDLDRPPAFVRADMRRVPFASGSFDAVVHFFTAFGYFPSDEENFSVLQEVARVLRPGGFYLIDFLSAPHVIRAFESGDPLETWDELPDGSRVQAQRMITADRRRVEKRMVFHRGDRQTGEYRESVRLFRPEDLRNALAERGLAVREEWGSYNGLPYDPARSDRWIGLCQRTG